MDGLLIGRFQPFHLGHLHAVRYCLSRSKGLWMGIGSSNRAPDGRNPFSAAERREMIESSLDAEALQRIRIFDIPDLDDHVRWAENVERIVPPFGIVFSNDETTRHVYSRRGITVSAIPLEDRDSLSGTVIRAKITGGQKDWQDCVPGGTLRVLLPLLAGPGITDRLHGL